MDFRDKEKMMEYREINTMRILGISISSMTLLLSVLLTLWQMDYKAVIIIVSIFVLGLTLIMSYISIGTRLENTAGEATSLIIILTTLSNLIILVTPDLKIYFLLAIVPLIFVFLYLFENTRLRKIFFLNILTIILVVKIAPWFFPFYMSGIVKDLLPVI